MYEHGRNRRTGECDLIVLSSVHSLASLTGGTGCPDLALNSRELSCRPHSYSPTCVFILASLVCLFVANGLGQEPIRVNVRLVTVAFSARDSRGALVENLTKD